MNHQGCPILEDMECGSNTPLFDETGHLHPAEEQHSNRLDSDLIDDEVDLRTNR